jgi:hypothetical protein
MIIRPAAARRRAILPIAGALFFLDQVVELGIATPRAFSDAGMKRLVAESAVAYFRSIGILPCI